MGVQYYEMSEFDSPPPLFPATVGGERMRSDYRQGSMSELYNILCSVGNPMIQRLRIRPLFQLNLLVKHLSLDRLRVRPEAENDYTLYNIHYK
jgi:hypothetical protein